MDFMEGAQDMIKTRQTFAVGGLLAVIAMAAYMVVQLSAQNPAPSADLRNAQTAELRDAQGQVVLSGQFVAVEEDDDDVERKAVMQPTGADADAAGEAEVEFAKDAPTEQEVEFAGRSLQAGARYTLMIDGVEVAAGSADRGGELEVEQAVGIPGAAAAR
jgi:hypothetical protein